MRSPVSVQRLAGLPPVIVMNLAARALGQESPEAAAQEILVVHHDPTLGQALTLFADSLAILLRCGCRSCRRYAAAINRGHLYANHWYFRNRAR